MSEEIKEKGGETPPDAVSETSSESPPETPPETPPEAVPDLASELDASRDALLRAHAEMENLRKRTRREIDRSRLAAIELFARDLLGVLDNIRRAEALLSAVEMDASVKEGIAHIFASAETMLARHRITRIIADGARFDPNLHEALFEDQESAAEIGTITRIIEEGYRLGDRLLRPVRVVVAGKKQPSEEERPENHTKNGEDIL